MAEHGGRCRPSRSRAQRDPEPFDVKLDGLQVRVMLRGRVIRTLAGDAADEVRRALAVDDGEGVQRIVARRLGIYEPRG
jgi:hypothetical protein